MKRLICIASALCLTLGSCEQQDPNAVNRTYIGSTNVKTYIIDDCEYLGNLIGDSRSYYLTHKGNCKNSIHYDIQTN